MIVVTIVVCRSPGAKSSVRLGRFSVPEAFFCDHFGDSGRNGRITINGMAGISPDLSVYRHAACDSLIAPPKKLSDSGMCTAGRSAAQAMASPLAPATSNPPIDENACV